MFGLVGVCSGPLQPFMRNFEPLGLFWGYFRSYWLMSGLLATLSGPFRRSGARFFCVCVRGANSKVCYGPIHLDTLQVYQYFSYLIFQEQAEKERQAKAAAEAEKKKILKASDVYSDDDDDEDDDEDKKTSRKVSSSSSSSSSDSESEKSKSSRSDSSSESEE